MFGPEYSVTARQVFEAQGRGEPVALADVRSRAEYESVHAVGARHHALDDFDPERTVGSFDVPGLGTEVPLYLTCYSGQRAAAAAEKMVNAGYPNVKLVDGGTQAWETERLPVVRGQARRVVPLAQQVQIAVGLMLLLKTLLGVAIHPVFFVLTAALGVGLVYAGLTQNCLLAQLLSRMPWNRLRTAERPA